MSVHDFSALFARSIGRVWMYEMYLTNRVIRRVWVREE